MKHIVSTVLLLIATAGLAQDYRTEQLDELAVEMRLSLSDERRFSLFAVFDAARQKLLGILPGPAHDTEETIAGIASKNLDGEQVSVNRIYTGAQRILLSNANEIVRGLIEVVCKYDRRPDRLGFSAGFSTGLTMEAWLEWDVEGLCP